MIIDVKKKDKLFMYTKSGLQAQKDVKKFVDLQLENFWDSKMYFIF